jgi:predicted nucleic acid-binding protein
VPGPSSSGAGNGAQGRDDTAGRASRELSVDGEEGFKLRLGESGLSLRKGDRRVSMPYAAVASARWERRHRYSRTVRNIGIVLLVAVGLGAVLIALYHLTAYDALVLVFGGKEYQLSGDRELLEKVRSRILKGRAGAMDSSE